MDKGNLHPADMIFDLREKKKAIEAEMEVYRKLLLELPEDERDGSFTRTTISEQERKRIDTKKIKEEMGKEWIEERSVVSTVQIVRIDPVGED